MGSSKLLVFAVLVSLGGVFSLPSFASSPSHSHKNQSPNLSDILPVSLVEILMNHQLWSKNWESPKDFMSKAQVSELLSFWNSLNGQTLKPNEVVDTLFGPQEGSFEFPELYPTKVHLLRFAHGHSTDSQRNKRFVQQVYESWIKRYMSLGLKFIEISNLKTLQPITINFQNQIKRNEIQFVDLDRQLREKWLKKVPLRHREALLDWNRQTSTYVVTGFYASKDHLFTVDLARPLSDTIVSFTHEMVHASDPYLQKLRQQQKRLRPQVEKILKAWLGSENARELSQILLDGILFETGASPKKQAFEKLTAAHLAWLKKQMKHIENDSGELKLKDEDVAIVRHYLKNTVQLTLGNEYRAYSWSLLVYQRLSQSSLIPRQSYYRRHLQDLIQEGPSVFATKLFIHKNINPFPDIDKAVRQKEEVAAKIYERLQLVRLYLEAFYLSERRNYLASLPDQLEDLREEEENSQEVFSQLPYYARPGGFDGPTNPYTILDARFTTAWVLRIQRNIHYFQNIISDSWHTLLNLYFGIIDIHELTPEELKLVGLLYSHNKDDQPQISPLGDAMGSFLIPRELRSYFPLIHWNPQETRQIFVNTQTANRLVMNSQKLKQNLLRIQILKTINWLDRFFPAYHPTLYTLLNFLKKLNQPELYTTSEFSEERIEQLKTELHDALKTSHVTRDDLYRFQNLAGSLLLIHRVAEQNNWTVLARRMESQIKVIHEAFETLRIYLSLTPTSWQNELNQASTELQEALKNPLNLCKNTKKNSWTINGPWRIELDTPFFQFPATGACQGGHLLLIRRRGENKSILPLNVFKTAPHQIKPAAKLESRAPWFELSPLIFPKTTSLPPIQ